MTATVRRRVSRVGTVAVTAGMLALTLAATGAAHETDDALRQAVERRLADEAAVRTGSVTVSAAARSPSPAPGDLCGQGRAIERAQGTAASSTS